MASPVVKRSNFLRRVGAGGMVSLGFGGRCGGEALAVAGGGGLAPGCW